MFDSKEYNSANPENKKISRLDFNGKKYDINLLTDEVKDLLKGLQIADTQIRMHKDTLRLLDLLNRILLSQTFFNYNLNIFIVSTIIANIYNPLWGFTYAFGNVLTLVFLSWLYQDTWNDNQ
jgi:hypothetical protein